MLAGRKKKTTKGRQKVELKRIENEDARYICFSKRRNGVFSKASEISTLCGAEVLVLIYSPAGKPHTFGSPDVNQLADRFFSNGVVHPVGSPAEQAYHKGRMRGLNVQMMELSRSVEALKARNNSILECTMAMIQGLNLDENEEGMTLEKLTELNNKLVNLKEQAKGMINLDGNGYPHLPADHQGTLLSSYSFVDHQPMQPSKLHPLVEPPNGPIQQDLLNCHRASPGSMINPFEPYPLASYRFTPLNATRGLASSSEGTQLFQVNWSVDQNPPANLSPFDPEFYQGQPSSSTNFVPKLNNLF